MNSSAGPDHETEASVHKRLTEPECFSLNKDPNHKQAYLHMTYFPSPPSPATMMLSVIVGDSSEAQNKDRLINSTTPNPFIWLSNIDLIHAGYTF